MNGASPKGRTFGEQPEERDKQRLEYRDPDNWVSYTNRPNGRLYGQENNPVLSI